MDAIVLGVQPAQIDEAERLFKALLVVLSTAQDPHAVLAALTGVVAAALRVTECPQQLFTDRLTSWIARERAGMS